ncbi:hypothetical protein N0V94_005141 [Neodidymelliopsis sp. IMI 364377]|nr:hypothetical protein N0V94_005141 [Neodidymelliopsis sp. IMI 364377]
MFHPRFKLRIHILIGILVIIVVGLSVPRLFMKNQPRTRGGTIALGMGAKSLILLGYMLATEHVQKLKRWHSYKANVVISCLEVVFWVVGLAIVVNHLELYTSAIAIREFREYRKMSNGIPLSSVMSRGTDEEEMVQRFPPRPENAYRGHYDQRHTSPLGHQAQIVRGKQ